MTETEHRQRDGGGDLPHIRNLVILRGRMGRPLLASAHADDGHAARAHDMRGISPAGNFTQHRFPAGRRQKPYWPVVKEQKIPRYDTFPEFIANHQADLAVIASSIHLHCPQTCDALRAGLPVLCEKPLALRHEDLDALYAAVKNADVQCAAILGNCAHPVLRAARKAVQDGLIGDIILCNARKSYKFGTDRPFWFGRRDFYGGTIPWIGMHALDFIESATGLRFTAAVCESGPLRCDG